LLSEATSLQFESVGNTGDTPRFASQNCTSNQQSANPRSGRYQHDKSGKQQDHADGPTERLLGQRPFSAPMSPITRSKALSSLATAPCSAELLDILGNRRKHRFVIRHAS
jgi:hypothetical protein